MSAVTATRPDADRITCGRCEVDYRPDRTDGACPVCRTPAPDAMLDETPSRFAIEDTRAAVLLGMSALNFLLLDIVALMLFG